MTRRLALLRWTAGLALVALIGCAPTPRPVPPQAQIDPPAAWRADTPDRSSAPADGWSRYGDPRLSALIAQALAHNSDVLRAAARVEQARERIRLADAGLLPTLDAALSVGRSRQLGALGVNRSLAVQPSLEVAYEVDLWGRLRRLQRSARLQYQASESERAAVRLAVASTTARAYVRLLSLDEQHAVTGATVAARREALRVAEDRAALGYTSQLEVSQALAEYEAAAELLPQLEQAIREQEHALRLLTGRLPGPVERGATLAQLQRPRIAAGLPSELLRRRPDLRQAERLLAASDQNLQAQRDLFLPQVRLSANLGRLFVDSLDYDPVRVWSLGGSVLAPLFAGGRLEAGLNIATAQRDEAAFAYRGAVLQAFSEVENALSAIEQLGRRLARIQTRQVTLERSLQIAQDRYRSGYSSHLEVLDAQRQLFDAQLTAVALREALIAQSISLYQALGGPWDGPSTAASANPGSARSAQ